ncbi:arginine-fifty homeobox [Phyllostomus discolor]|uniref:Arginine-fifty homeobox n=1 Tax=Phyllostomus discolor TaxID=89673 RepID=A0A834EHS7_9CHIR|nr:arginine-fifty homeobox [Phyllostomus discolor]
MSVSLMNRMAPENLRSDLRNHIDDSRMNVIPQSPAGPTTRKKHQKRTLFMHTQQEQLKAVFSCTMFPDKNLRKELALKLKLPESTIKTWFRNHRVKVRKQQQEPQPSPKQLNQILPAKIVPTSTTTSTNPYSSFPAVSDFCSSLPPQPVGPSSLAQDSFITGSPTSDDQMPDPQLEGLEASVPALYSDAYDIEQIMELYSFPDEDETPSTSFHCLYQYLSPADSS